MSSPPTDAAITRDWTCPFCALLCDDLAIEARADATLAAPVADCPRLSQALACYGAGDAQCASTVDANATRHETALARAAQMLAAARRPLFSLATDVAGTRALYALAARCGAIVDHPHGDALSAATLAFQDRGAIFTTLSEVRTRADLIVVIGCEPSRRYPRFYTRTLAGTDMTREVVFVACDVDAAVLQHKNAHAEAMLRGADLFDLLARWSALSVGRAPRASNDAAQTAHTALSALQTRIAAARYTAFVYEPAALPGAHAALLIEALHRIVKSLNGSVRAGCLALGGSDGALTVNQAMTWLSGLPLRTRIASPASIEGAPMLDYDPYRYRMARLVADREIDALLFVASFAPPMTLPDCDPRVPAIVLGPPALAQAANARGAATVFMPVATPGIDSGGHLFRTDGTVVLPLRAARAAPLPTVAALASELLARLDAQPERIQVQP